ncbi:MAG: hypothetical protein HQL90_00055 [Magnetococcales bacterium]|nr:hypothetical protein [Magnetococcales bacterium]
MPEQPFKENGQAKPFPENPASDTKRCPTCKKGTPLWFISWADMVTLLLCLFVIIVAYSTQEKGKYLTLAGSLRDAFGSKNPDEGIPPIPKSYHVISIEFQKKIQLMQIKEQVEQVLFFRIDQGQAKLIDDEENIIIQIDRNAVFPAEGTTIEDSAQADLVKIASIIKLLPVMVEINILHTKRAGSPPDWQSSVQEAASIARLFENQGGILSNRIQISSVTKTVDERLESDAKAQQESVEIRISKTTNPEE